MVSKKFGETKGPFVVWFFFHLVFYHACYILGLHKADVATRPHGLSCLGFITQYGNERGNLSGFPRHFSSSLGKASVLEGYPFQRGVEK